MKVRIEPQGVHCYFRKSGKHVLFDEIRPAPETYSLGPRTVSIALTDVCDFTCSYCYVKLKDTFLRKEDVISYCLQLDRLGTLDIAFGGGEPTLHPDLVEICETIWRETQLGISITTHGHHLNEGLIQKLEGNISFIRISIDGIEPVYSQLRNKPLSDLLPKIKLLSGRIPFGINTVVNKLTVQRLDDIRSLFLEYGAFELLLLPMWRKGKYTLSKDEWSLLNSWIQQNYKDLPIRVSKDATQFLELPYLFGDNEASENDYAFIGIDKTLRRDSFTRHGIGIDGYETFEQLLKGWWNSPLLNGQ